jgi:hypothetical protein
LEKLLSLLDTDERGIPVLLADPTPPPRHDLPEIVTPDGTSGPAEWGRYHDAVREASRSYDNPDHAEIQQFLRARARNPEKVDVPAFHEAVRRHRMADLVDIADHHLRRGGSLPRGSRMVRIQAPKNYLRKALRSSSAEDLAHLRHRLTSIGHDHEHVSNFLASRATPDMWDQASSIQVNLSDGEFEGLTFDSVNFPDPEWDDDGRSDFAEAIGEAFQNLPAPVINVYINTTEENQK